jgi:transcription termination factor NusB
MSDPTRAVAFHVLRAVAERDAYVNLVLPAMLAEHQIEGRDAAFATELVHGTVRRQGTYDAIIGQVASKGLGSIDPPVLDALRLGTHQLLNMRVPAHAAVSETVDLVRREIGHKPVHFANALLRKIGQKDLDGWLEVVTAGLEGDEARSVRTSHPVWIVTALREALGGHAAQIDKLLAADNAPTRCPALRASSRPTPASSTRAVTRGRYRRSATAAPACRTRAPSWSRSPSPRLRSTATTPGGSTSARGRAARLLFSVPWRSSVAPTSLPTRCWSTAPSSCVKAYACWTTSR